MEKNKTIHFVGSGITSLCAGALFSEVGYNVHILESHPEYIGGHTRTIEEQGFKFCAGPQYVWAFDNNQIGERVLKFLDLYTKIPFDYMDKDGFETIKIGESLTYKLPMGLDNLSFYLISEFPKYNKNILHFIKHMKELNCASVVLYNKGLYLKNEFFMKLGVVLSPDISFKSKLSSFRFAKWSLKELFTHCGLPLEIQRILHGHSGVFSESYSTLSAFMHGGATGLYHAGAQFPRYGFKHLIEQLTSKIESNGGTVEKNKKVTKFETDRNKIYKIICEDGSVYNTELVVSNISPRLTYKLLDQFKDFKFKYKPSNPLIGCYIGVSNYSGLAEKIAEKNIWWYPNTGEADFINPNVSKVPKMLYVGCPTLNGEYNKNSEPNYHSLITFIPGNYEESRKEYLNGSDSYEKYKKNIEEQVISTLDRMIFPGIKNNIKVVKIVTPQDLVNNFGFEFGNVYGRRLTAKSILKGVGKLPKMQNLHLANATIGMPGVATAFQTAAILFHKITSTRI